MISPLPSELVAWIAAGEVMESPGAVVRELVENALDAGASRLVIRCWPDQGRLEVLDNGQGMGWEELQDCALPHSTSKIQSLADLQTVQTLGFRGEALHSLAQVGQLTITSRPPGAGEGWRVQYDCSGQVIQAQVVAIAGGTRVEVRELFNSLPSRRPVWERPLPLLKTIQDYLLRMALCHPGVTWQLWLGDRLRWCLSPGQTGADSLLQGVKGLRPGDVYAAEHPLTSPEGEECGRLTLMFGYPDRYHRRRPDWVVMALNGRPVHWPEMEQTVLAEFHRTLPRHRYPLCFSHFHLPSPWIDWNRHPAKTEVAVHPLLHWQSQLKSALHQGLTLASTDKTPPRVEQLLKVAEPSGLYQLPPNGGTFSDQVLGTSGLGTAIAQVNQTYIVVEQPQGIWLVEQHVAHERVLFEQLQTAWRCEPLPQPLLLGQLTPEQVERLQEFGLEIDPFGEDLWAVRTLPSALLDYPDPLPLLQELSRLPSLDQAQAAIACQTAIKNGTPLDRETQRTLIHQWQQCRHPHTCPHGRPIYLALQESSLARFFRRNWIVAP